MTFYLSRYIPPLQTAPQVFFGHKVLGISTGLTFAVVKTGYNLSAAAAAAAGARHPSFRRPVVSEPESHPSGIDGADLPQTYSAKVAYACVAVCVPQNEPFQNLMSEDQKNRGAGGGGGHRGERFTCTSLRDEGRNNQGRKREEVHKMYVFRI